MGRQSPEDVAAMAAVHSGEGDDGTLRSPRWLVAQGAVSGRGRWGVR